MKLVTHYKYYGGDVATESNVPGFTRLRLALVIGSLSLATMLGSLETTIIATALPILIGEFNAFESFAWVGTAYIATSAISTPLLGKLSDLFGRRRIFLITMTIFLVGSLLCGAAQTIGQLIAARALQGVGGGGIMALSFAIIGDIVPPRDRGRYIGYFTLSFVGAALLGPLIGGFIIERYSWPWIFWINIPLILAVTVVCFYTLKLPFNRRKAKIDYRGAVLLSITIGALMIALEEGRKGWTEQNVLILFAVTIIGLVFFILAEQRASEPMIPLRLFKNPIVLACSMMGLFAGAISFGSGPFLSLYFQDSLFVSPTESGLRSLPQMLGVTAATFGIGRIIARTGRYKPYPIIGAAVSVVGLTAMAQINANTSYLFLVLPMIAMGFGTAAVFSTTSIAGQNAVGFEDLGVTTATIMFFRSLGGSLGMAIFGTVLNSTITRDIPKKLGIPADQALKLIRSPEQIKQLPLPERTAVVEAISLGVSHIYWLCVIVAVGALIAAILLPEKPLRMRANLSDALETKTKEKI